jgi:hypothetical protein
MAMKSSAPAVAAGEKEFPMVKAESPGAVKDRAGMQGAEIATERFTVKQKRKEKTAADRSAVDLTVQVGDTAAAIREIEGILGRLDGRIIDRQRREGEETLRIEIAGRNIAAFLDRIRPIGKISGGRSLTGVRDTYATFIMKIRE